MTRRVHLKRALSKLGVASRGVAGGLILRGEVRVNGTVARDPLRWVDLDADRIDVAGAIPVTPPARIVLALWKPRGIVTTRRDERGRKTVYDLLPDPASRRWVFPVGRLDRDSEGLLLFTDDGPLSDRLTDPERAVPKTYLVSLDRLPAARDIDRLRRGVVLDGRPTRPCELTPDGPRRLRVVLREGRNREIRRMFHAVGHRVLRLVRIAVGAFAPADLSPGESRILSAAEVALLEREPPAPARGS